MSLDLPTPPPLQERSTQVIVKLCVFGFAPLPLLERFTQVIVKLCDFGFAPPPLRERSTQVNVKLFDFVFDRATASPGEIYTGKCEAL